MDAPQTRLILTVPLTLIREFYPILQSGFLVTAHVGCTLQRLLSRQWGIAPEYIATRITTIFLDAKATDNVESAIVSDGSTVALSGAMPGLVGATMRRGGHLAAMRGAMTHHGISADTTDRIGTVKVKLFNLLLPELGPEFLKRGLIIGCDEMAAFFQERDETFWKECDGIHLNGALVGRGLLQASSLFCNGGTVRLSINFR